MSNQARVPAGVETGGRFTTTARQEPDVALITGFGMTGYASEQPQAPAADRPVPHPRRSIPLTPEQVEARARRITPVAERGLWPARAQGMREASDLSRWSNHD